MILSALLKFCNAAVASEEVLAKSKLHTNIKKSTLNFKFTADSVEEEIAKLACIPSRIFEIDGFYSYFVPSLVKINLNDMPIKDSLQLSIPMNGDLKEESRVLDHNVIDKIVFANLFLNCVEFSKLLNINTTCLEDKDKLFKTDDINDLDYEKIYMPLTQNKVTLVTITEDSGYEKHYICFLGKRSGSIAKRGKQWRILLARADLDKGKIRSILHLLTVNTMLFKRISISHMHMDSFSNYFISSTGQMMLRDLFYDGEPLETQQAIDSVMNFNLKNESLINFMSIKRGWLKTGFFGEPFNAREILFYPLLVVLPFTVFALYILVNRLVLKRNSDNDSINLK